MEKDELSRQIEAIENEIQKLNKQKMELETKNAELHKKSREIEIEEATESTLRLAEEVDDWNSMEITLSRYSKTTPIFDRFFKSDLDYLIIKRFIRHSYFRKVQFPHGSISGAVVVPISLIIIKKNLLQGTVYVKDTGLTISDIKTSNSLYPDNTEKQRRLSALANEITNINYLCYDPGDCISFEHICSFGAQIYRNRTGYGSRFCGEELVHKGTLYGETTPFYIIGVRWEE